MYTLLVLRILYKKKMNNYENIPNLDGKVAIVSGANSGTGYGITYHLAKHNCKVIMASRNESKLQDARNQLLKELPNAELEIEIVDLTNLDSIKQFCDRIKSNYKKIHFLVNNAGGGNSKYSKTADGLESTFTINYLGHFAVTTQLLPVLKDGSRIVTFSSIGYKRFLKNHLDVDNLMCENSADFNQMQEYCKGKLCSILFAVKLQKEFERIGLKSMSLSCHPGWARTNLAAQANTFFMRIFNKLFNRVSALLRMSHSLYKGALPAIEALIADSAQPYKVYSPSAKNEMTGIPIPREIDHTHYKNEDIDRLWFKSQELVGIKVSDYL
ncbi:SDR family NAD(P)-dependent oxidoreductase [Bacillus sp. SCS-151]|uniref:SDR family NAD(P)-dependent oxidoreductase n=1 Tax=Nanhaiella sioensis TaxID=3115293 RepID=UPI00397D4E96